MTSGNPGGFCSSHHRSHSLSNQSNQNGRFAQEIVAVEVKSGRTAKRVEQDDHLFPRTTLEGLSQLAPAWGSEAPVAGPPTT